MRQDLGHAPVVVEEEQAPGAVPLPRLAEHGALHRARVLGGLDGVAQRGVGIADHPERGGIGDGADRLFAPADGLAPASPRRFQPCHRGEQAVIVGEHIQPRLQRVGRLVEPAVTQRVVAGPQVEPGELFRGEIAAPARRVERRGEQPPGEPGIPPDLRPAREPGRDRQVTTRRPE